jgi:acyl carrier protein
MMEIEIMKEKIKQYLEETFLFEFNDEVTETSDLFKLGILDSFGYIQLIAYLEREFHVEFSEEEMLSNVLVSFANIMSSVAQKVA